MLQKQILEYYYWDDIEEFLCEKMGISQDKFRNYHDVVGGDYKDFWHVWLKLVWDDVFNGKISTVFFDMILDEETQEDIKNEFGDWINPLFLALKELETEIGEESFEVKYFW